MEVSGGDEPRVGRDRVASRQANQVALHDFPPAHLDPRSVPSHGRSNGYLRLQSPHGLIGPKGMPQPVVARINTEVTRVLELKDAASQLQNDGVTPAGGSPESFREAIRREIEVWRKVVREAGIKAE